MPDREYPGRPTHPDFWMMSRIIIEQDERAKSHAVAELIAEKVDVHSAVYMASQRARRARFLLTTGPIEARLTSLWLDAFLAGMTFEKERSQQ